MFEPAPNIFWRDLCERVLQGVTQGALRTSLERAEKHLELGNALLNRSKVGRVRGQILHAGPRRCDQADDPRTIVERAISQQHDVVSAQVCREPMLHIQLEDCAVDRPFNPHRRQDSTQREGADNRNAPSILAGLCHSGSFPPGRTGMGTCYRRVDRKFIYENQRWPGQARRLGHKLRPCYRVRFTRPPGLFFRVRAKASTQRQTVLTLTRTRVLFLIPSRSSARVASGCSATKSPSTS